MNIVHNYIYKVSVLLGCAVFTILAPSALAEDTCDLCDATKRGQYDLINAKLSEVSVTVSVNGSDDDGYTALIWAAKKGHLNIVKLLMTNTHERANVELKDNTKGRSALLWASGRGQASIVEYLLRKSPVRANPNASDNKGKVGLDIALKQNGSSVIEGSVLVFKALLDNGANVSELDVASRDVFAFAAQKNNNDLLKALIESEGNLEVSYKGAPTFLLYAVKQDNKELATKLIEGSANVNGVNSGGRTPLIVASNLGHEDMVRVLLSVSAISVGHQDSSGKSALDYAMTGNYAGVVTEFLYGGVALSFAINTSEYIRARRPKISSELVKALLMSSTVDVSYEGENSILLWAVKQGKVGLVRALLADGANKEREDNDGNKASYVAAGLEEEKIEKVLEDPLPSDYEHTLRWSLKDGRVKGDYALRDALDNKGSVDIAYDNENSILLWAVKNNKVDLVSVLVDDGADEDTAKDSAGDTALYIAIGEGYEGIVKLLENDLSKVINTMRWALNNDKDDLRDALVSAKNVDIAYGSENSILLWAVRGGHTDLVKALVADGANEDTKDYLYGYTALYLAIGRENLPRSSVSSRDIQKVLKTKLPKAYENTLRWALRDRGHHFYGLVGALERAGSVNIPFADAGSILLLASKLGSGLHTLVKALISDRVNLEVSASMSGSGGTFTEGWTALHHWLFFDNTERVSTIRALLDAGANKNARTKKGWTPLRMALTFNHLEVVKDLVSTRGGTAPADVNVRMEGLTSYHTPLSFVAGGCSNNNLVKLFLGAGADITLKVRETGSTALILAAHNGCDMIVDTLLMANSTSTFCYATNKDGYTALDVARSGGHNGVVAEIESHCPAPPSGSSGTGGAGGASEPSDVDLPEIR